MPTFNSPTKVSFSLFRIKKIVLISFHNKDFIVRGTTISDRRLAKIRLSKMLESKDLFTINDMITNANEINSDELNDSKYDELNKEELLNILENQNMNETKHDDSSSPDLAFNAMHNQAEIERVTNKTGMPLNKLNDNILSKRSVNNEKKARSKSFLSKKIRFKKILPPFIECWPVLSGNFFMI
jgi:hypothetical protein